MMGDPSAAALAAADKIEDFLLSDDGNCCQDCQLYQLRRQIAAIIDGACADALQEAAALLTRNAEAMRP